MYVKWPGPNDGRPIIGATDTDRYVYYKIQEGARPTENPQLFTKSEPPVLVPANPSNPAGYPAGVCQINYASAMRSVAEQTAMANTVYKRVVETYLPGAAEPERQAKLTDAVLAKSTGLVLTVDQLAILDDQAAAVVAIKLCDTRKQQILDAINSTPIGIVDMYDGWPLDRASVEALFT